MYIIICLIVVVIIGLYLLAVYLLPPVMLEKSPFFKYLPIPPSYNENIPIRENTDSIQDSTANIISRLPFSIGSQVKYEWKMPSESTNLCEPGDIKKVATAYAIGTITKEDPNLLTIKWEKLSDLNNGFKTIEWSNAQIDTAWNAKFLGTSLDLTLQTGLKNTFTKEEANKFLAYVV